MSYFWNGGWRDWLPALSASLLIMAVGGGLLYVAFRVLAKIILWAFT